MQHDTALTLLASGIANKDAISKLLRMELADVDVALALNTNLKQEHIEVLIDRYKDTADSGPYAFTYAEVTAILVASRLDLSEEQIWKVLQSGNANMRHAVLTRDEYPTTMFDSQIGYLLHEPWFTPQYAKALADSNQLIDADVRDRFLNACSNRYTIRKWEEDEFVKADRNFTERSKNINHVRQQHQYGSYIDDAPLDKHLKRLAKGALTSSQEALESELLPELLPEQDIPIASWLEGKFGATTQEFYEIFFSLIEEWEGSLADLATTVKSLAQTR